MQRGVTGLKWELDDQPDAHGNFICMGCSGELCIGSFWYLQDERLWFWNVSAVKMPSSEFGHEGYCKRKSDAKRAIERVWARWLKLAGLVSGIG